MIDFSELDLLYPLVNSGGSDARVAYIEKLNVLLDESPEETLVYLAELVMQTTSEAASELDKIVADLLFSLDFSFAAHLEFIRLVANIISKKSLHPRNRGFNLAMRLAISDVAYAGKFIELVKILMKYLAKDAEDYQQIISELVDSLTELSDDGNNLAAIIAVRCSKKELMRYIDFISKWLGFDEGLPKPLETFLLSIKRRLQKRMGRAVARVEAVTTPFVNLLMAEHGTDADFLLGLISSGILDAGSLGKLRPYRDRVFAQLFNDNIMRARFLLFSALKPGTSLNKYFELDTKEKRSEFLTLFFVALTEKFKLKSDDSESSLYLMMLNQQFSEDLGVTPAVKFNLLKSQSSAGHLGICLLKERDFFHVGEFVELLLKLKATALVPDREFHALLALKDYSRKSFVEYFESIEFGLRTKIILLLIQNGLLSDDEVRKLVPHVEMMLNMITNAGKVGRRFDERLTSDELQGVLDFFQESVNPASNVGIFFSMDEEIQPKLANAIISFILNLSKKIDLSTLKLCLGLLQSAVFSTNPARLGELFETRGYKFAVAVVSSGDADLLDKYLKLLEALHLVDKRRCLSALANEFKDPDGSLTSFTQIVLQKYPAQPQLWLRIINTGASVYYTFTDFLAHKSVIADELIRQSRALADDQAIELLMPALSKDNPLGKFMGFARTEGSECSISRGNLAKINAELSRRLASKASAPVLAASAAVDAAKSAIPASAVAPASVLELSAGGAGARLPIPAAALSPTTRTLWGALFGSRSPTTVITLTAAACGCGASDAKTKTLSK